MSKNTDLGNLVNGLFVNSSGNVGVGTQTPRASLDVTGNIHARQGCWTTDESLNGGFLIGDLATGTAYTYIGGVGSTGAASYLSLSTNAGEKMRITSTGNVGIGTTSPSSKLVVNAGSTSVFSLAVQATSSFDFVGNAKRLAIFSLNGGDGTGIQLGYDAVANTGIIAGSTNSIGAGIDFYTYNGSAWGNRMRVTSGGNVLIGTTSVSERLTVGGGIITFGTSAIVYIGARDGSVNYAWYAENASFLYFYNSGTASVTAQIARTTGVYTALSDVNKKKDFEESNIGLNEVLQLKPTLYRMKTDDESSSKDLGFIAQEVKELIPQAYSESGEGDKKFIGLNQMPLIAALTKAIQELKAEIEILKQK